MGDSRRHVLVVGADRKSLDRMAPVLRRADFVVHTVDDNSLVMDLVQGTPFELLVVSFPTEKFELDNLLDCIRSEGAPCKDAGFLLLAEGHSIEEAQLYVDRGVNRAISLDWTESRLWQALGDVSDVAPRVFLHAVVKAGKEGEEPSAAAVYRAENISESGMLLKGTQNMPPGTRLEFKFALPGESDMIEGTAEVVRATDADRENVGGFGTRFISFRGDGRERLDLFIEEKLKILREEVLIRHEQADE